MIAPPPSPSTHTPLWLEAVKAQSLEPHSQILEHRSLSPFPKWPNRIRKRSASISPGPRKRTQWFTRAWLKILVKLLFSHLLAGLSVILSKKKTDAIKSDFLKSPHIHIFFFKFDLLAFLTISVRRRCTLSRGCLFFSVLYNTELKKQKNISMSEKKRASGGWCERNVALSKQPWHLGTAGSRKLKILQQAN